MIKSNYKLLKQIESKLGMWTGYHTLKSLHTYLHGYEHALRDNNLTKEPLTPEPFFDWVAEKLGYSESTAGWANMILAVSIGLDPKNIRWKDYDSKVTKEQHELSIRKFYELLEEFVNEEN